ncbi:E3 ubiquitin-protein ligase bre1, partial [Coemansia brasiliensis]
MTERKRRSEDGRDADAQPPPTLAKKRHTAKADDFEALSAEFDENAAMLDLGAIREFQKEAIWRQMQEYKRDAQRAEQRSANIEQRQAAWEERIAGVCTMWDQAIHDLDAIVNGVETAEATEPQTWLDIMLPRKLPASSSSASDPAADNARAGMEKFNASVNNVLRQLQAKSKQSEIDWQAAIDRLSQTRATQADMEEMKAQVALLSRQLTESKEMLELRESELRRALKQLDRQICPTVRKDNGDAGTSSAHGSKSPNKADAGAQDQHAASPAVSTPGTSSGGVANGAAAMSATAMQAQQDREQFKQLAESRLAEIEEKVRENTELQMQVDSLKLQIAAVPDYVISETPLYKQ